MLNTKNFRLGKSSLLILLGLWLLLGLWGAAWPGAVELHTEKSRVELGSGHLSYLRDPTAKLDMMEALAAFKAGQFRQVPGNLGLGYTKDAVWVAFAVNLDDVSQKSWVLQVEPTTLDLIELYQINNESDLKMVSGDGLPMSQRAMVNRGPAFPLTLPVGDTVILLRIKTSSQMTAIPFLWQAPAFDQAKTTESLYFGLYFGFLLTLFTYSLVNAFSMREKTFLLFPPYLLLHGGFWLNFDGLLALHVLPENPVLVNQLLGGLLAILSVMGNYLYANLLKVGPQYKITRWLLAVCYLSGFVSLVSIPLGAFALFMPGLMVTTMLALPVLAPHAWRQIYSDSVRDRIFGATYLVFGSLVVITIAMNLSLLPANLWTHYASQFGQMFHAVALLMGLHFWVLDIQQQQENSQLRLHQVSRDAEKDRSVRQEQEQLLHMIGHEVRTPISIIASAIDSLKLIEQEGNKAVDPAKEQRYQRIHKAIKRMEMLMQLVGSEQKTRLETSEQPRLESLNFRYVCQDNLDLLTDAGGRIHFEAPPHWQPVIQGDAGMLGFLMLNLYDNAFKYAIGSLPIQASLHARSRDTVDGLVFSICNQARPLAPGMEERIFEKFVRIDENRSQPGLGLGLYLARQIAAQHHGTLVAYNSGPQQVCFELWLPLSEGHAL